ncbi:MAG: bifunctional methylenetetrahydrofolate dehydrogenase/methenyltetrahydrofolate cyclohydrolase FolD [Nitrospinota bacterium]|jgi:methylenetetrahydrofolate dehydrogenase (NADP+)/methenyltetrahydrofolate cyclohydrolase|nr:bifunctional methylenetetrahydrofolate dehydrogenase/methenyltetrahydrofolate cyclohydrolase FolD [Nitrospinota bacterium]|tara:strand:- start:701 stop:1567 length:867 start_codon:yes stop_codon:yes gene_type:complete
MEQKTSAIVMKGKPVAEKLTEGLRSEIEGLAAKTGRPPGLAVVLVGEDPASQVYVRIKERTAKKLGILTFDHRIPENLDQGDLLDLISRLNSDPAVDGILIQLPLPGHLNEQEALRAVALDKDVDVFHPENFGRMALKQGILRPCTPAGVIEMLKHYEIEIEGKSVALIGRSKIVGLPLSLLLLHENATITVCHSRTSDIGAVTREADIVVAALGRPKFLTADMVKEGAVVVDIGINRVDEKLVGDCDYDALVGKVSAITPVPGGVGPMTVAMLMANTVRAFRDHASG